MNFTKLSFACLLTVTIFLVGAKTIQAAQSQWLPAVKDNGLGQIGNTAYNIPLTSDPKDIRTITANLVNIFLGLLGTIFIVLMIAAGFTWMTAAGNADKVKKAIDLMVMGAIGLLIVLTAFAISLFVTSRTIYSTTKGFLMTGEPELPDLDVKTNEYRPF